MKKTIQIEAEVDTLDNGGDQTLEKWSARIVMLSNGSLTVLWEKCGNSRVDLERATDKYMEHLKDTLLAAAGI